MVTPGTGEVTFHSLLAAVGVAVVLVLVVVAFVVPAMVVMVTLVKDREETINFTKRRKI